MATNRKQPHILFVTRAYSPNSGGMERLSYKLIQAVSNSKSVKTQVIAHHGSRRTSPLFIFYSIPKVLSAAKDADVIHLGDPMLSFTGWLVKLIFKKPVAVTVHGLDISYPNPLYQLYLKLFFRRLDTYLPISQYVNTLLEQLNVKGSRHVINPGIHDRFYDPTITRQQLNPLLKRNTNNHTILFTGGRLVKKKGHAWFISNVLPHLPPNTLYIIAGNGPERDNIQHAAVKNSRTKQVILLGRVSEKNLKILYNTVDAFIQPSINVKNDVEGFGLVLLEAALCNRPVFAANIEGIPDAIQDGKNGILVTGDNSQAWVKTLNTFISQQKNSSPAVTSSPRTYTLNKFSWDDTAAQYINVLLR